LALVAPHHASEDLVAAFRAEISVFFVLHPLRGADFPSQRRAPQYHLFSHGHGKFIDEPAGKVIAEMTSGNSFGQSALPDIALPAVHEPIVGQASVAMDILGGQVLAIRQEAFAWDFSFI
jgi:hypothetical protein